MAMPFHQPCGTARLTCMPYATCTSPAAARVASRDAFKSNFKLTNLGIQLTAGTSQPRRPGTGKKGALLSARTPTTARRDCRAALPPSAPTADSSAAMSVQQLRRRRKPLLLVAVQLTGTFAAAALANDGASNFKLASGAAGTSGSDGEAAPAACPPPRWWVLGGGSVMALSPKVALGRGLWPQGQMVGLPAYLALLDQLHADGVSTLQLATVYDCGASNTTYSLAWPDRTTAKSTPKLAATQSG